MMAAYVIAAHALSPHIPIADLVAASAVVMFAASVPISLAGWGVRELSAIVALGAIGMSSIRSADRRGHHRGLVDAFDGDPCGWCHRSGRRAPVEPKMENASINVGRLYARAGVGVAHRGRRGRAVSDLRVPIGSGMLNVNLADPFAMLAGEPVCAGGGNVHKRFPRLARQAHQPAHVAIATAVLAGSLLLGAARFGWTEWALVNRFLGWFVLLCFVATGALIVQHGGREGFKVLLLTYVGALASIAIIDLVLVLASAIGIAISANSHHPERDRGLFAKSQCLRAFSF